MQTCAIDGTDTANVKAIVALRRSRTDANGIVQWMTDTESQASGVTPAVSYVIEHVLDRAAGTYTPPNDPVTGLPIADVLLTPQMQGLLAQIAGGLLGAVTTIGQALKVL